MYIALVNIHGLVRSENIEMGRDADTGGQIRYVIDLINQLSENPDVQVDLFTRKIGDKRVSEDYQKPIEQINENCRIVRLPCGSSKYIRKEKLWPYLDEYVDRMIEYFRKEKREPDIIHGHYADAGYIAREISNVFNTPMVFTGHSLGRNKLDYLLSLGMSRERVEEYYFMNKRIKEEEENLRKADLVITSTEYERDELYTVYENSSIPKFQVIPPGLNLGKFFPYYHYEIQDPSITEEQKLAQYDMVKELNRFYNNPDKPIILALCRPERRKNIDVLIGVYGKSKELQALANMAIVAGIRDDINSMEEGEQQVLTDMLLLMDRYDLYGKMAIPKHHSPERDVPELYRLAAMRRGIFVSAASVENFGLTFIEASATGLPFIGTNRGGVRDINKQCSSGILVNVENPDEIREAMLQLLTDEQHWDDLSRNGIEHTREVYNWKNHCEIYMNCLEELCEKYRQGKIRKAPYAKSLAKRMSSISYLLIVDIDNTLIGDEQSIEELKEVLEANRDKLGFGVATGRDLDSTKEVLQQYDIAPDVMITSVGTEIYYGNEESFDKGWCNYIRRRWRPDKIRQVLGTFDELELQGYQGAQMDHKISYYVKEGRFDPTLLNRVKSALDEGKCSCNVVFSHEALLDILPYRASKGNAVKYLGWKWQISSSRIITAGDSGNDRDMLSGPMKGIVVANYEESMEELKSSKRIYFSDRPYAGGIIDGLKHYKVISQKSGGEEE